MTKQWNPDGILEALGDAESRQIIAAASVRPVSAQQLAEICEVSQPTVYRRLDVLEDYDLISEQHTIDADGEQHKQYTTNLKELTITLEDGGFNVSVEVRKDAVDRFGELFRDLSRGHDEPAGEDPTTFQSGSLSDE